MFRQWGELRSEAEHFGGRASDLPKGGAAAGQDEGKADGEKMDGAKVQRRRQVVQIQMEGA